jgi:hypothetical protein
MELVKSPGTLDAEGKGTTFFRNVGKDSPDDKAPHPRRLEFSAALLWRHQIWQFEFCGGRCDVAVLQLVSGFNK